MKRLNSKKLFASVIIGLMVVVSLLVVCIPPVTAGRAPTKLSGLPEDGKYNYVTLGDVNNDGFDDIICGAGGYPGNDPGGLYVYLNQKGQSFIDGSSGLPGTGKNYFGSVQVIDIDKDSNLDIVASFETRWSKGNQGGIGIWLGNGGSGGSMSWTAATTPVDSGSYDSANCADIDNDGILDLVGASADGLYAWKGSHSGNTLSWTEVRTGLDDFSGEGTGITLGDINKDGRLDIVAGSYNSKGISIYLCSSSGTISWSEGHSETNLKQSGNSFEMYLTDLNNDKNLDIIAGLRGGVKVYLGNGNSGARSTWWTDVSDGLPTSSDYYEIAIGDINNDGQLDVGSSFKVWFNTGDMANLESYIWEQVDLGISESSSIGLAMGDLNKDTYVDLVGCGWEIGIRAYTLTLESQPPKYYKLYGKITDQADSSSLKGATIQIDNTGASTKTSGTGEYEFELTNGSYELTITFDGYKSAKKLVEIAGSDLEFNFQLIEKSDEPEPTYKVSGVVKDGESGRLLAGLSVTFEPGDYLAITNGNGEYSIDIPDGSYILKVQSTDYQLSSTNVVVNGASVTQDITLQPVLDPIDGDNGEDKEKSKNESPGFEIIPIIGATLVLLVLSRRYRKRNN